MPRAQQVQRCSTTEQQGEADSEATDDSEPVYGDAHLLVPLPRRERGLNRLTVGKHRGIVDLTQRKVKSSVLRAGFATARPATPRALFHQFRRPCKSG